jgi:hypothetical protein
MLSFLCKHFGPPKVDKIVQDELYQLERDILTQDAQLFQLDVARAKAEGALTQMMIRRRTLKNHQLLRSDPVVEDSSFL